MTGNTTTSAARRRALKRARLKNRIKILGGAKTGANGAPLASPPGEGACGGTRTGVTLYAPGRARRPGLNGGMITPTFYPLSLFFLFDHASTPRRITVLLLTFFFRVPVFNLAFAVFCIFVFCRPVGSKCRASLCCMLIMSAFSFSLLERVKKGRGAI